VTPYIHKDLMPWIVVSALVIGCALVGCACTCAGVGCRLARALESGASSQKCLVKGQIVGRELDDVDKHTVETLNHMVHVAEDYGAIFLVGPSGGASCMEMVSVLYLNCRIPSAQAEMRVVEDEHGKILKFMVQVPIAHMNMLQEVYHSAEFQASRDEFVKQPQSGGKCCGRKKRYWQHKKRAPRLRFVLPSDVASTTASCSSSRQGVENISGSSSSSQQGGRSTTGSSSSSQQGVQSTTGSSSSPQQRWSEVPVSDSESTDNSLMTQV